MLSEITHTRKVVHMDRCGRCGNEVTIGKYCSQCGSLALPPVQQPVQQQRQARCPRCGGTNFTTQIITDTHLDIKKGHGCAYWLFIGWWLQPLLWILLTLPMIIIKIFRPKKYTMNTTHRTVTICQQCGHTWNL